VIVCPKREAFGKDDTKEPIKSLAGCPEVLRVVLGVNPRSAKPSVAELLRDLFRLVRRAANISSRPRPLPGCLHSNPTPSDNKFQDRMAPLEGQAVHDMGK
jgi:hypothetical protein